ncbi:hypothetical protein N5D45_01870 [Stenotrophomonas sp. GD03819]|uniref:hypothetical protein n=1 Tax=Stenotrophomonas sp. GD03819 TaxID=2975384 RepID=UPI002449184C|nr:hypothetical protein [Stenotrophomonas sp. GD03819]MDH1790569.1 hypothetical protein [Stenotrophomonas sp. GD03819]
MLVVVMICLGFSVVPNLAMAQAQQCSSTSSGCDQGVAYAACMSELKSYIGSRESLGEVFRNVQCTVGSPTTFQARFENRLNSGSWSPGIYRTYTWGGGNCSARLDGDVGMINGTMYSGGVCDRGCKVQPNLSGGSDFSLRESGNPNVISIKSGTWRATGELCSVDSTPPKPERKDEYCHQTGNYTVCKSKEKTCISTASGFRTCASDTANEKGHTATNNPRTEAASISSPNTPPNPPTNRPGEDWKPSGPSTSVTNNSTGSTTNTQNYNNQGTPNGNQPTPGDGSGPGSGGSNGNGDGDDGGSKPDYGSVGGDGKCTGSFTCSGGDPVLCAIAQQTYNQRCEAEARWGDGEGGGTFPGDGDGGAGQDPDPKKSLRTATPSLSMIDKGGFFGGGSCPQFAVADTSFGPFSFNDVDFCKLIVLARNCLMFLGAFIALGILMGWQGKD